MDSFINSLLIYFIYFIVAVAIWHYAVPTVVKKEIKRLLGIFFKWLLFGKKPKEKKKDVKEETPNMLDKALDKAVEKKKKEYSNEHEKELEKKIKTLESEIQQLKTRKDTDVVLKRKEYNIDDEIKRQKEIAKELW